MWLGLSASLGCCMRHPTGRRSPSVAGCLARNKHVVRREKNCLAGIKCFAWVFHAPSHGQSPTLCCDAPSPESSAQHAGRAGTVVMSLPWRQGDSWLACSAGACVFLPGKDVFRRVAIEIQVARSQVEFWPRAFPGGRFLSGRDGGVAAIVIKAAVGFSSKPTCLNIFYQ